MKAKLPPLSWFRSFEAAARHLNMTQAAQELGLTQPAVSQQVQLLEHRFNMTLFERRSKGLVLTDAGRRLLPQISESIDGLNRLISEFDVQQETTRLNIEASSSFACNYITPLLPSFLELHPTLRTRIRTTLWHDDYLKSDADLEVRFGSSGLAGSQATELCRDRVVAVCAPDFFSSRPDWGAVCSARRIQTVAISETWERWANELNLSVPENAPHIVDSYNLAIDLALAGVGVTLMSLLLAAPYLRSGALIIPIAGDVEASERFFIALKSDSCHFLARPFAEQIQQKVDDEMQMAGAHLLSAQ